MHLLSEKKTYVALDEEAAYKFIEDRRQVADVETSSVKFKKATKKKAEHWIVEITEKIDSVDAYVLEDFE